MALLRRVVVDVLKPHDPPLPTFTDRVADAETVAGVTASLVELDQEVQNVQVAVEGDALDYDAVTEAIEGLGATVHSIDQVVCGDAVAEAPSTPGAG